MFYTILKAITNYQCGPNFTAADYIDQRGYSHIYMTVLSFGSLYGIMIYVDHIKIELLKQFEPNYEPPIHLIFERLELSVIYSLLKICRKELYDKLFWEDVNKNDINYLKDHLGEMTPKMLYDVDIYLAIFALMDVPKEGGTLTIGDKEVTLTYTQDENELTLMPRNSDWGYMGRGLWLKMCEIIAESKK